jgi:hypothetical protein
MAAPTSAIQIVNMALDRMGMAPAASIDAPTTPVEDVMARWYDQTRRELIRRFIPNFARKYAQVTVDADETPAFGFANAYAIPQDFIRLLSLGDVTLDADVESDLYDISNGYIYTDHSDDTDTLNLYYLFDAQTVGKYDPLFVRCFYLQLAQNTSYKFTLKPQLKREIENDLENALTAAAAVSGQEKPVRRIERSRIRNARKMGGTFRDNRYV